MLRGKKPHKAHALTNEQLNFKQSYYYFFQNIFKIVLLPELDQRASQLTKQATLAYNLLHLVLLLQKSPDFTVPESQILVLILLSLENISEFEW